MSAKAFQRGFTLVELIMVIVIMGVIGGMVSVFMRGPIDAYFASARRAELTDVADTTVRRLARDIRRALPNSLRLPAGGGDPLCIDFIPTKTGGRYRVGPGNLAGAPAANVLVFNAVDASFNMLGNNAALPANQQIVVNDLIAINNLGIPGADAYAQGNTDQVNAAPTPVAVMAGFGPETRITTVGRAAPYPLESGNNRFHVIPGGEQVVSYVCTNVGTNAAGNGTGTLYRLVRALPQAAAACPAIPVGTPVLAQNVSTCAFVYNGNDLQRNAMLQVNLGLTQSNETVGLYHEIHVNNTP